MTQEAIAENLIFPLWRCVSDDFKNKYKGDAWGYFENFLRSAACAERLTLFFDKFKRLIPMNWQHKYEAQILSVLQSGEDYTILQALRDECSYLVLLARDLNNQRKELLKQENA